MLITSTNIKIKEAKFEAACYYKECNQSLV